MENEGNTVELDKVLVIAEDGNLVAGKPFVEGAKIKAQVMGEEKGKKILVFKYKSKVRYRRKRGHRQIFTRLSIVDILRGGHGTQNEVVQNGA